jgi:hypothetical protein
MDTAITSCYQPLCNRLYWYFRSGRNPLRFVFVRFICHSLITRCLNLLSTVNEFKKKPTLTSHTYTESPINPGP